MTDDEPVGYGRPPRKHQFQVGNKAASKSNRRGKKTGNALELPELIDRALRTKRKIKRGNQVYSLSVAEMDDLKHLCGPIECIGQMLLDHLHYLRDITG